MISLEHHGLNHVFRACPTQQGIAIETVLRHPVEPQRLGIALAALPSGSPGGCSITRAVTTAPLRKTAREARAPREPNRMTARTADHYYDERAAVGNMVVTGTLTKEHRRPGTHIKSPTAFRSAAGA